MKRKFIIRLCSLVMMIGILTGCYEDLLDQKPLGTVTSQLFWSNYKDADAAVNGMYSLLRRSLQGLTKNDVATSSRWNEWGDYFVYGDMRSGDWWTPNGDNDWKNLIQNNLRSFSALKDLQNWRFFYRVIEQCNQIITYVPEIPSGKISEEQRNEAIAQAKSIRGFTYLYIARIWGDAPLNITVENVTPLPRTSKSEILAQAEKDLTEAIPNLPVEFITNGLKDRIKTRTRMSKGAALATLAHVYMWMEDYQKAFDAVTQIENLGIYRILDASQYRSIFDEGETDEGIFEIYYSTEQGEDVGYYGQSLTWFLPRPYTTRGNISATVKKQVIMDLYEPEDKRIKEFYQGVDFTNIDNVELIDNPLSVDEDNIIMAKYRKATDGQYLFENNVVIFRYAGLLLLKAEAAAQLGSPDQAVQYLNIVRNRAGLLDYSGALDPNSLVEEVLQERRRELVAESHRFYDLLRTGTLHKFTQFITADQEALGAGYWPINDEAFRNNPNMEQNNYWK